MTKSKPIRYLIIAFSILVVVYPLWVSARQMTWAWNGTLLTNLFPLFGLAAFAILWLHIVGPAFEPWLSGQVNFKRFLVWTEPIILVFMLAHPLALLIIAKFNISLILSGGAYIVLGIVGLLLLVTFDISTALKKRNFVERHWNKILMVSTIGFILIFFHSYFIGHDTRAGELNNVWLFFGITAILSAVYNYGVKRFIK